MPAIQLQEWHDFYIVAGGAAATLMGVLFVAISLNAPTIFSYQYSQLRHIAEQAFRNFISVILTTLL